MIEYLTPNCICQRELVSNTVNFLLTLPLLAVLEGWIAMAMAIAVFGAALGTVDIAMNLQAIIVERNSGRPMMSGFHGLYSVGGIAGASLVVIRSAGHLSPLERPVETTDAIVAFLAGLP